VMPRVTKEHALAGWHLPKGCASWGVGGSPKSNKTIPIE
jgi:hypothetical protein